MDKNNQLETAPIGKLVFKLAIPTVMAQLVNLLYNIVDRIYVGRIPEIGSLSLAPGFAKWTHYTTLEARCV